MHSLKELDDLETNWLEREGIDEEQEWLQEGIDLYRRYMVLDKFSTTYSTVLANLYLRYGRDEKMRYGNYRNAYDLLRKAIIFRPNNPDAYYHLSFILGKEERKWESSLFYAKEGLENGIQGEKEIKLRCHMALAYARLGFIEKSRSQLMLAKEKDYNHQLQWFIELYEDEIRIKRVEPILFKEPGKERSTLTKEDYDQLIEKASLGECYVLDLSSTEKIFRSEVDDIRLEPKEADILGLLIESNSSCSRNQIGSFVWPYRIVSDSTVNKYIATTRTKLSEAIVDSLNIGFIKTVGSQYQWESEKPCYVLRGRMYQSNRVNMER